MTIAILGSTGRVGGHLTRYALAGGHALRILARDPERVPSDVRARVTTIAGDARDQDTLRALLEGCDVAVSALGGTGLEAPGTMLSDAAAALVAGAREAGVGRILWVSASGLLDAPGGGLRSEAPEYPPIFHRIAGEHRRVWSTLRAGGIVWTLVCPPHMPTGERTGRYRLCADRLPDGGRQITDADVADFIAKELEAPQYPNARVGIAY